MARLKEFTNINTKSFLRLHTIPKILSWIILLLPIIASFFVFVKKEAVNFSDVEHLFAYLAYTVCIYFAINLVYVYVFFYLK